MRYNVFSLIKNSFSGHKNWQPAWREPEPKTEYDIVIVGAGGHGLATAYYLAKNHKMTNIAVVEKAGWAAATPGATPQSSARTTSRTPRSPSMSWPARSTRTCRRT